MSDPDVAEGGTVSAETEHRLDLPGFGPPPDGSTPATHGDKPSREHAVRNVVLVLGSVVLVAIVVVVLIGWLFMSVVSDAVDDVESGRNATAITVEQYKSIELGTREDEVRARLGEPDDETLPESVDGATRCLYYNEKDAGLVAGDRFKFCFTADQLVGKSRD